MFTTAAQLLDLTDSIVSFLRTPSLASMRVVDKDMIRREAYIGPTRWEEDHWRFKKLGSIRSAKTFPTQPHGRTDVRPISESCSDRIYGANLCSRCLCRCFQGHVPSQRRECLATG